MFSVVVDVDVPVVFVICSVGAKEDIKLFSGPVTPPEICIPSIDPILFSPSISLPPKTKPPTAPATDIAAFPIIAAFCPLLIS